MLKQRKWMKENLGFTLVELIIVMGIMGIVAGVFAGSLGYIKAGKTKKAAAAVNNKLGYAQTETMAKEGKENVYLFTSDGSDAFKAGVYVICVNSKDVSDFNKNSDLRSSSFVQNNAQKVASSRVTASATVGGSGDVGLGNDNMLKMEFNKATGAFTKSALCTDSGAGSTFYDSITLKGTETFSVELVQASGKHYVE